MSGKKEKQKRRIEKAIDIGLALGAPREEIIRAAEQAARWPWKSQADRGKP